LAPKLRQRAQHFQLACEELLVHYRELDVLLDSLRAADTDSEIVHVATQDTPGRKPGGPRSERGRGCGFVAIVARRRVARKRQRFGRAREAPYMLSFADRSEEHTSELQSRGHLV